MADLSDLFYYVVPRDYKVTGNRRARAIGAMNVAYYPGVPALTFAWA